MQLTYSDSRPNRGAFLVYLNGIEVPAMEVSVQYGIWQFPQAHIALPPDKELIGIGREDRMQVAIFYLDQFYSADGIEEPEPAFRLLFEGEITASEYQASGSSCVVSLTAVGHTAILTQIFPFFVRFFNDIVQARVQPTGAADRAIQLDNPFVSSIWFKGIDSQAAREQGRELIKRPYDFIENMMSGLMGLETAKERATAAHVFFSRWARQNNFHNRWAPCPYLETRDLVKTSGDAFDGVFPALKAVQTMEALDALRGQARRIGDEGSLWDVIQAIFSTVYYEVLQIPAPPMAAVDLRTGEIMGEARWGGETPYNPPNFAVYKNEGRAPKTLEGPIPRPFDPARPDQPNKIISNITKPQLMFAAPPSCNVIYPSETISKSFSENYATQPTRIYISDPSAFSIYQGGNPGGQMNPMILKASTVGYPPEIHDAIQRGVKNPSVNPFDLLVWPEEYFKGPVVKKHSYPAWFSQLNHAYLAADPQRQRPATLSENRAYRLFASYEYFRERASQRYGQVSMLFDPYVLPGFPGVVLDKDTPGLHFFAYFGSVQHRLGQESATTNVSFTFGQHLHEFFDNLWRDRRDLSGIVGEDQSLLEEIDEDVTKLMGEVSDADRAKYQVALARLEESIKAIKEAEGNLVEVSERRNGRPGTPRHQRAWDAVEAAKDVFRDISEEVTTMAEGHEHLARLLGMKDFYSRFGNSSDFHYSPASPFPDIRYRFQNIGRASQAYSKLLFRRFEDPNNPLSKDLAFDWRKDFGVMPEGVTNPDAAEDIVIEASKTQTNAIGNGLAVPKITVRGPQRKNLESYRQAMKHKSRPACTLEEYISFFGDRGVRYGKKSAHDAEQGKGATFYEKILDFKYEEKTRTQIRAGEWIDVETRQNWEERLLRYRNKVIKGLTPFKG